MATSSKVIANQFIDLAGNDGKKLTNMQLQKLVFIAHGYCLAILERSLYREDTRAWQWGPVEPRLYKGLQTYGKGAVLEPLGVDADDTRPDEEEMEIINAVWKGYKRFSGGQLSALTHQENTPWSRTWEKDEFGIIPLDEIASHYKRLGASRQGKG